VHSTFPPLPTTPTTSHSFICAGQAGMFSHPQTARLPVLLLTTRDILPFRTHTTHCPHAYPTHALQHSHTAHNMARLRCRRQNDKGST